MTKNRHELREWMERRLEVVEEAVRTGKIVGIKVADLREGQHWQRRMLCAIHVAARLKTPQAPSRDAPPRFLDGALTLDKLLPVPRPDGRRRPENGGDDRAVRDQPRSTDRDNDRSVEWTVTQFLSQQLLCYFLQDDCASSDKHVNLVTTWVEWLEKEVKSLYDATLIELLAERDVFGHAAIEGFRTSLHHARYRRSGRAWIDFDETSLKWTGRAVAFDKIAESLPASQALRGALATPTTKRNHVLWRLIGQPKDILQVLDVLTSQADDDIQKGIRWFSALIEELRNADLLRSAFPQLAWLLDLDLLREIAQAASHANATGQQRVAKTAGKDETETHADQLERTRRRLQPLLTDMLACRVPADDIVCRNRHSEAIWWRSFGVELNGWSPERVAAFGEGAERARWVAASCPRILVASGRLNNDLHRADRNTAIVYGAGIAGLTAAHELAERGFKVHVIEKNSTDRVAHEPWIPEACRVMPADNAGFRVDVGGVARTQWSQPMAYGDKKTTSRVPGEHGFRHFPSFYRHVFDTMKRTPLLPYPPRPGVYPTAFDQLEPTRKQIFARRHELVPLRRDTARNLESFRKEYMSLHDGLGFSKRDMARFFFKLLRYLMTSSERRKAEYENISLLQFFDPALYSEPFVRMIKATPQALVAMNAEHCDARTQGNVFIQLLLDQVLGSTFPDGTLQGPTSTAWFDHWRCYLTKHLNVSFWHGELLSLHKPPAAGGKDQCSPEAMDLQIVVEVGSAVPCAGELRCAIATADYHVVAADVVSAERLTRRWNSLGVPSDLRGYATHVTIPLPPLLDRFDLVITLPGGVHRVDAEGTLAILLERVAEAQDDTSARRIERSAFRTLYRATGAVPTDAAHVDEVRLSLWFQRRVDDKEIDYIQAAVRRWLDDDQRERFISRQPEWVEAASTVTTLRMPDDGYGDLPQDRLQTFTGIQYYFAHDFKLVRGHVYFPESEWGLSAISQAQLWRTHELPGDVRGVLSVDIGDCRKKSSYLHKPLVECTPHEIATEVWRQITDSLRSTRGPSSIVTSLPLPEPLYFHIDSNLVFTGGTGKLRANLSPFLINNVGDWDRRPKDLPWVPGKPKVVDAPRSDVHDVWQAPHGGYRVHADKVVFCGSYMRTFTRMNTMEAANESGRHAVNAILDHLATHGDPQRKAPHQRIAGDYCDIWDPEEHELEDLDFFKRVDKLLFEAGKPHIADILQFDKIADLQHPDPTPLQALVAALGSTVKSDWGMTSTDLLTSLNGLMQVARTAAQDLATTSGLGAIGGGNPLGGAGGALGGFAGALGGLTGDNPLLKLLGMLGLGKGKST